MHSRDTYPRVRTVGKDLTLPYGKLSFDPLHQVPAGRKSLGAMGRRRDGHNRRLAYREQSHAV